MKKKPIKKSPVKRGLLKPSKDSKKNGQIKSGSDKKQKLSKEIKGKANTTRVQRQSKKNIETRKTAKTIIRKSKDNSGKPTKRKTKVINVPEIKYNQNAINEIRKRLRKSDGTFFSKEYYQKIVDAAKKNKDSDIDNELIKLRNKNKDIRYYTKVKSDTLYFQTQSFVDRLSGKIQTKSTKKGKDIDSKTVFSGELKKGSKIVIRDLKGDEYEFTSIGKAVSLLREQNNLIDSAMGKIKEKNRKASGLITLPEEIVSDSEGNVISVFYDYESYKVNGVRKSNFDYYLNELLDR